MADSKISAFPVATSVNAVDTLPLIQTGANRQVTVGQLKTAVNIPSVSAASTTVISLTNYITVSGDCILPASTVIGQRIVIRSTSAGRIISTGLLDSNGYTFGTGAMVELLWSGSIWLPLFSNGMTVGIA